MHCHHHHQTNNYSTKNINIIYHINNLGITTTIQSSDPSFRQSADCLKLSGHWNQKKSRKGSVQKKFRSCFLLLRSSVFFKQHMEKHVFLKKRSNFSEVAFRLLRTWGFVYENLSLAHFFLLHSFSSLVRLRISFLSILPRFAQRNM